MRLRVDLPAVMAGEAASAAASVVAPPHLGVVALGDMGAGVGAIAAQGVVARDLLGAEQRRRLEMARQVDVAQLRTGGLGLGDERTQAGLVEVAGAEGRLDRLLRRDQPGARIDGLGLHRVEDLPDRRDLIGRERDLLAQFQQMRRAGNAFQFCGEGKAPAAPPAQLLQIAVRESLDRPRLEAGMGRGMAGMILRRGGGRSDGKGMSEGQGAQGGRRGRFSGLSGALVAIIGAPLI